jgi:protein tyrosine/serine phosphatase
VKRFIADNAKNGKRGGTHLQIHPPLPDKWIGVHCTHGLNRTGFLICRFLIQELGWDAQRAMQGLN